MSTSERESAATSPRTWIDLLTASKRVCTPVPTLRKWLAEGRLKFYKPGKRVLLDLAELDRFIAESGRN